MTDRDGLRELGRRLRGAYENLGPGPRAILRRCRTQDELHEEGWFWHLVGTIDDGRSHARWLGQLVVCFPSAAHRVNDRFDLGAHVRRRVYSNVNIDDLPKKGVAFRRLLAARDADDLTHQLRRVLLRAAQPHDGKGTVDWGVVGADLKYFGDHVRRRWATGFFTDDVDDITEDQVGEEASA
jgi:CRISPR type I-E-associated protein CasB/Cse2